MIVQGQFVMVSIVGPVAVYDWWLTTITVGSGHQMVYDLTTTTVALWYPCFGGNVVLVGGGRIGMGVLKMGGSTGVLLT